MMQLRHGVVVVRQAGSAAGILPAAEELLRTASAISVAVIAFPQAAKTCKEVVDCATGFIVHEVATEHEAHHYFLQYINGASFVLTGTSEQAAADSYFWQKARELKVESIAYLDQWSNIDKRFPGPAAEDWPDHLAVIDAHDRDLIRSIAPREVQIHITGSPALTRIKREVARLRANGVGAEHHRFVFATEPVSDLDGYRGKNGFCDEDSFDLLIDLIRAHHAGATLVIRLHPRDDRKRWLPKLPRDIRIEWDAHSRAECLARAGKVFGMRSFFLLEALSAGVPVFSLQPGRNTECPLTDGRMPVLINAKEYKNE